MLIISGHLDAQVNTRYIDSLFSAKYAAHHFNGQVLIAEKGKIVFEKKYGLANYEKLQPFTSQSRFQIASVTKQFTAAGILCLQRQGKLSVEDKGVKYLPKFPFKNVSIQHLMTHSAGIPQFVNTMWKDLDTTMINGNRQMLALLQTGQYSLQWNPGDKWEYCDIGYCTLATLIEKVSGQSFNLFLKKNLFIPASMRNTAGQMGTDIRNISPVNMSMGYLFDFATKQFNPAHLAAQNGFVRWLGGFYDDGSVTTTARDLLKRDRVL